jgi:carbamoyltransferase
MHARRRVPMFYGTKIEALAIGNCFLRKEDQPAGMELRYENTFTPD